MTAVALIAGFSIAPTAPAQAASAASTVTKTGPAQTFAVDANVVAAPLVRDSVTTTAAVQNLRAQGTNEDWARLVLISGAWPQSEQNVTVMLRWMRQENGPDNWWNRNNPLNNGYGSGGGSGLGSYSNLVSAAEYAAANLHRGYPDVVAALTAGTSADATAAAIWASPWATSHYGNGSHWSTSPVPIIAAPQSAWE
ncbi:MAG: hypothetical protein ABI255_06505 [Microbacteriaceae bacterium]